MPSARIVAAAIDANSSHDRPERILFWALVAGLAWAPAYLGSNALIAWGIPSLYTPNGTQLEKAFVPLGYIVSGLLAAPIELAVLVIGISRLVLSRDAGPLPAEAWLRPAAIVMAVALVVAPLAWIAWGLATS